MAYLFEDQSGFFHNSSQVDEFHKKNSQRFTDSAQVQTQVSCLVVERSNHYAIITVLKSLWRNFSKFRVFQGDQGPLQGFDLPFAMVAYEKFYFQS